ncbi:hypothetical protein J6590_016598 [Homalodisca vitripennis]|nr:hypothetical protein J6590_016598 [Homalodisca vitripennis]
MAIQNFLMATKQTLHRRWKYNLLEPEVHIHGPPPVKIHEEEFGALISVMSPRKKRKPASPVKGTNPTKFFISFPLLLLNCRFLRPLQDYSPPHDALERCEEICSRTLGPNVDDSTSISRDPQSRFTILNDCFKAFKHSVPNSLLYQITTVGALKNFYATPISTTTPLDKMRTMELPENLHVQHEPLRFHPGQAVNAAFYLEKLKRLKRRMTGLRPEIKDVFELHHDNASSRITNYLTQKKTPVVS